MNQEFNESQTSLIRINTKLELMKLAHAAIAEVELLENQVSTLKKENQAMRGKQEEINLGHNIFANEVNALRDTVNMLGYKNQSLTDELGRLKEVYKSMVLDLEKEVASLREKQNATPEVDHQLSVYKEANDAITQENDELTIKNDLLEQKNSLLSDQLDEVNKKLFMALLDKKELEDKIKSETMLMELLDAKILAILSNETQLEIHKQNNAKLAWEYINAGVDAHLVCSLQNLTLKEINDSIAEERVSL